MREIMPILRILLVCIIALICSAGIALGEESADSRSFQFSYQVVITGIPKISNKLEVWLPLPQSNDFQEINDLQVDSDYDFQITTEPEYGNQILYVVSSEKFPEDVEVTVSFTVIRREINVRRDGVSSCDLKSIERFLMPDELVPIDGAVKEEARKVIRDEMSDLEKARAAYDYLARTMDYDKSGSGWGRGDALYACDVRKGNCTDFHSLFIGMMRSSGIPARFVIGFPIPDDKDDGEITGYHCWAEFYTLEQGWVPVDISEAHKNPERHDYLFGGLDHDRVQFTVGRDIQLAPNGPETKLNYFIYPHVLVDGVPYQNIVRRFHFASIEG